MNAAYTYTSDDAPRIRGRLPETLRVDEDFQRIQVVEERRSAWRILFITGVAILMILALCVILLWHDRDTMQIVAGLLAVLLGIPWGIAALFVCPWNRSVVVDLRDGICTRQRRFYVVPVWSRSYSLWDGTLRVGPVIHTRVDTVDSGKDDNGLGCLMHLLGPIGLIYTLFAFLGSVKRIEQPAWALMFDDTRSELQQSSLLIVCLRARPLRRLLDVANRWNAP